MHGSESRGFSDYQEVFFMLMIITADTKLHLTTASESTF